MSELVETETKWIYKVKSLIRKAYIPVINVKNDNDIVVTVESKFGGKPFTSTKSPWPICKCGEKMKFFLQLDSSTLPTNLESDQGFGDGLLQLFYCTNDDEYMPFSDTHVIRIIDKNDLSNYSEDSSSDVKLFPCNSIVDWNEKDDYISTTELLENEKVEADEYEVIDSIQDSYKNIGSDKLFGWPCWVQGVEYPNCRKCNRQMKYIFQITSDGNIPFCFGDCGIGHITQCEEHKDELAFSWACG